MNTERNMRRSGCFVRWRFKLEARRSLFKSSTGAFTFFILMLALQHQHWLCRLSAQCYYFRSIPAPLICIALDISVTIPPACIPVFLHRFNEYDSAVSVSIPLRHISVESPTRHILFFSLAAFSFTSNRSFSPLSPCYH